MDTLVSILLVYFYYQSSDSQSVYEIQVTSDLESRMHVVQLTFAREKTCV